VTTTLRPLLGAAITPPACTGLDGPLLLALDAAIEHTIAPLAAEHDASGRYPTRSVAALRSTGILGLGVPTELGGAGASHRASLEAQVRLGAADSSVAQVFKVHDELAREILAYCPAVLRKPLARSIVTDRHVLGLAVAEASRRVDDPWTTTALPVDGGWVVDGRKIYTTGAAEADEIAVWAFDPTAAGIAENPLLGARLLLIAPTAPGVTVHRDWDALGQRATDSGAITFDQVHCGAGQLASEPGRAPLPHASLRYQAGFAAVLVGIGIGAVRAALPFVSTTSRPWPSAGVERASDDPMVRRLTGELVAELVAAYHATLATGDLLDAHERGEVDRTALAVPIYAAKAAASRAALHATGEIHALMGTRSAVRSLGFDRWWRNARTLSLHDPLDWKHEEIGRHLLTGWDPPPGIYS
jgi:alkylation response protein AidB-like acyl-CoA dehydrogenase